MRDSEESFALRLDIVKTIFLADRRAADDLHGHIEVPHHAPHDRELLKVLESEDRHVRGDDIEQLEDNRCHATEMTRTMETFEARGQLAQLDAGVEVRRIDRVCCGTPDQVDPGALAQRFIGLSGTWIGSKVAGVVELEGVDEDRCNDERSLFASTMKKRCVPLVQRPHRGNK